MTKYVLSMTSHPPRFQSLLEVLDHVMIWNSIPERIYLNIVTDDIKKLPRDIYKSSYSKLLVVNPTIDLGPCGKLVPALELERHLPIVTIDDDTIFEPDRIDEMLNEHQLFPKAIIGGRTHMITRDENGKINSYRQWNKIQKDIDGPSKELFPTGVGMVLYPQQSLHLDAQRLDVLLMYSKYNDDFWHFFQARRAGTQIRQTPQRITSTVIEGTQEVGLWSNGNKSRNEEILNALLDLYGDPLFFKDEKSRFTRLKRIRQTIR